MPTTSTIIAIYKNGDAASFRSETELLEECFDADVGDAGEWFIESAHEIIRDGITFAYRTIDLDAIGREQVQDLRCEQRHEDDLRSGFGLY